MLTSTRAFLREFSAFKARARRGETVRIKDKSGEFIFAATSRSRRSLIGAVQGKIQYNADLTHPTLDDQTWNPSL